jgi:hypothetical protein
VEASFGDETRLILYALESQAERGPCEPRSKWGMSAEDRAKHETWVNLGKMEPFEAMRLFVKLMDEERPGWWKDDHANPSQNQQDKNAAGDASGARVVASPVRAVTRLNTHTSDTRDDDEEEQMTKNEPAWVSNLARGIWVTNPDPNLTTQTNASGPFGSVLNPAPRYRHASCVLGDEMFVVGGSDAQGRFCKGAELFHVLNLNTGAWRAVATKNLKPCAGARLVTFRGNAFLVGGDVESFGDANASDENANSSDDETDTLLDVSRIDFGTDVITGVETATFVLLRTKNSAGEKSSVPRKRRGHTACVVPGTESLVVFGGEDENRRFLNDARVLDMRLLVWRTAYEGDRESGFFGGFFFGLGARAKQDDDERHNKSQAPTPRAEHVAAAVWARNDAFPFEEKNAKNSSEKNENHLEEHKRSARATLLVLGGAGASGKCFDDAYALDLETGRWMILRLDEYARDGDENENENENENGNGNGRGSGPGPRAGHASCVFLGRYLCLVGGGNDTSERREHALASVLDLRSMTWLASPRAFAAPPGAGEGMSLCVHETKTKTSTLLAFGGYDGACRDETHAFRVPLAFLDDDPDAKDAKDGPNADVDRSARNAPRRSLFGRLLDPGPAPGSEDSRRENDPVRSGSAGSGNARTPEPPSPEPTSGEKVDALARDNLRLRRENARLREEIAEAHRLSESMRGRLEQSESRFEETSAALVDARRAVAALETDLSASREGERKRLEATRRDLASQASQRNVSEAEGRAEAAGETRVERDESEEEEEPESRRGWLFGL